MRTLITDMRNAHKILVGKAEVKRPFRRPRCRWENKTGIKEIRCRLWDGFVWSCLWPGAFCEVGIEPPSSIHAENYFVS